MNQLLRVCDCKYQILYNSYKINTYETWNNSYSTIHMIIYKGFIAHTFIILTLTNEKGKKIIYLPIIKKNKNCSYIDYKHSCKIHIYKLKYSFFA